MHNLFTVSIYTLCEKDMVGTEQDGTLTFYHTCHSDMHWLPLADLLSQMHPVTRTSCHDVLHQH